jgi:GNAT superfamily N-acetyltransferase
MVSLPSKVSTNGRSIANDNAQAAPCGLRTRPIAPTDAPAIQDAYEHLSPLSRYYRFHAGMAHLPDDLLRRLTSVDGVDHVALVAIEKCPQQRGVGVGVARFVRLADAPQSAEIAVTVIERAQGRGVARRLLAALAPLARERGITTFTMHVLAANARVRRMAKRMGAVPQRSEAGVIALVVPVDALDDHNQAA